MPGGRSSLERRTNDEPEEVGSWDAEIPVGREVDVAPLWRDPLSPPMFCNLAMNERRHEQTTREEVTEHTAYFWENDRRDRR